MLEREPGSLPVLPDVLVAALRESGFWLLAALGLLLLFFPDGRLPGPRWRWVPIALVIDGVLWQVSGALDPKVYDPDSPEPVPVPFGTLPEGILLAVGVPQTLGLMALTVLCAASLVVKYRRADGVRRVQLKWLAFAGLGLPVMLIGCGIEVPARSPIVVLAPRRRRGPGRRAGRDGDCDAPPRPLRRRQGDQHHRHLRCPDGRPARHICRGLVYGRAGARPEELEHMLRTLLRDPGLRVGYLVPGSSRLVDGEGEPVDGTGG